MWMNSGILPMICALVIGTIRVLSYSHRKFELAKVRSGSGSGSGSCCARRKTYTLTAGEEKVDLSSNNFGPADVNLLAAWLATPAGAGVHEQLPGSGCKVVAERAYCELWFEDLQLELRPRTGWRGCVASLCGCQ